MSEWKTFSDFTGGYVSKKEKTNLPPGLLIAGSQNVLLTDDDLISTRKGYTLDGAANTAKTPIESSYDWNTHSAVERNLRAYDDELEVRISGVWTRLADGWSNVTFQFAEYWDTNEGQDILLFVIGDAKTYSWSGGLAIIDSTTANTIKKTGTETWGEARFITNGTDYDKKVIINGTVYTYTGGEGTTTLTNVTPDPSGEADGSDVIQRITTHSNLPSSSFNADLIAIVKNQVYYGATNNRQIFISKVNDFNDISFSSPRLVKEGALLTLDGVTVGFIPQEDTLYITAGKDQWYEVTFTLSSDNASEALTIKKLNTTAQEAAQSQNLITKIKNAVVYISNEPTLDTLGRLQNIDTPQSKPLSDPIKNDFDAANFTNGDMIYFRNNIYIALPSDNKILIFNLAHGVWEAPIIGMPVRKFAIIGGELFGHSSQVPETYKLFDGTNDNNNAIEAKARFSYLNFGTREEKKKFSEWLTEGFIAANTNLTRQLFYEFQGDDGSKTKIIKKTTVKTYQDAGTGGGFGKENLGKKKIAGDAPTDDLFKFRVIHEIEQQNFHEMVPEYSSNGIDQQWAIETYGAKVDLAPSNNDLKR